MQDLQTGNLVSGDSGATAEGPLPLVVARCICKHVLQPVGLSQEEAHLLITPVDGGQVLQQHQEALSSNRKTSSHRQLQKKPTRDAFTSAAKQRPPELSDVSVAPPVISRSEHH